MDVLEHLTDEHRKVERLLAGLKASDEGSRRADLFDELDRSLSTHMAVEERFLYPLISEHIDQESADDATDEHDLARQGVAAARERLREGAFEAAIEILEAGIAHHVEEEESDLFPKLRERAAAQLAELDPEQLEDEVEADDSGTDGAPGRGDGPTRDELYEQARAEDIPGRSTMTKDELADALDR